MIHYIYVYRARTNHMLEKGSLPLVDPGLSCDAPGSLIAADKVYLQL